MKYKIYVAYETYVENLTIRGRRHMVDFVERSLKRGTNDYYAKCVLTELVRIKNIVEYETTYFVDGKQIYNIRIEQQI